MIRSRGGRTVAAIAGATLAGGLAGCAAGPSYDPELAATLRDRVLAVSDSAASGDWAAASTGLDAIAADTVAAHGRGDIDDARRADILAAVALVDADVDAALTAQREAEAAAAEARRLAEEAAAADDEDDEENNGNSGNGNGKGKKDDG